MIHPAPLMQRCKRSLRAQLPVRGFSLIEMAIVLLIVSILMSGAIVAISETAVGARRSATLAQLRQIEDALYGFAQSQGRLPCAASVASNGYEDSTPGACARGFIPSATLGLYGQVNANGILVDAWQNPIRYAVVASASAGAHPDFTDAASIRTFFGTGAAVASGGAMLRVSTTTTSACGGANLIADTAPALAFSTGANGNGFTSANEGENADSDAIFISTNYSEEQFDDQLIWLSPYILFNRLISAGKLP